MRSWFIRCLMLLLIVAGFLGGVIFLGQLALEQLRRHERYLFPLAAIECQPPPGLQRSEFLDEVQYLANLPANINLLEEGLPAKLASAFAQHPWVMRVEQIQIRPPRSIHVDLLYRVPVLAVRWEERQRAVTADGVLLPPKTPTTGLPIYEGKPARPTGPAGTVWNDPELLKAAKKASRK